MFGFLKRFFRHNAFNNGWHKVSEVGIPHPYESVMIKYYDEKQSTTMFIDCYRVSDFNDEVELVDYWHCTCGIMKDKLLVISKNDEWKYVGNN